MVPLTSRLAASVVINVRRGSGSSFFHAWYAPVNSELPTEAPKCGRFGSTSPCWKIAYENQPESMKYGPLR